MTTMTLSPAPTRTTSRRVDAPTARRVAARRPAGWPPPSVAAGCAGAEPRVIVEPVPGGSARAARVGVAPLTTAPARLTRRGRVLLALAFLAVVGGGFAVGGASVGAPAEPTSYAVVTVQPGQTLWGIANQVAPGVDPRLTVERLVAVNGLADANAIVAGDELTVPLSE